MNNIPTFEQFVIDEIIETMRPLSFTEAMRYLRGARDYYKHENTKIYRSICGMIDAINGK